MENIETWHPTCTRMPKWGYVKVPTIDPFVTALPQLLDKVILRFDHRMTLRKPQPVAVNSGMVKQWFQLMNPAQNSDITAPGSSPPPPFENNSISGH